jgi:hypothetical protein
MLDINLSHYNEMLRYEPLMDELRALAVIIIGREQEDLFNIIKYYSKNFAEDIKANGRISEACLNRFKSAMFTITSRLNITPEMIGLAHEDQLYKGSGFWEMRWNLGQFPDIAKQVQDAGISHIVCAGISGCVVGEYLGLEMSDPKIPVDHMIFERSNRSPVRGMLPRNFELEGKSVLLVEDAVQEARTLGVMMSTLDTMRDDLEFSLFALDIEDNEETRLALQPIHKIFKFEA